MIGLVDLEPKLERDDATDLGIVDSSSLCVSLSESRKDNGSSDLLDFDFKLGSGGESDRRKSNGSELGLNIDSKSAE